MQMVKIQIPDESDSDRACLEMSRRGRIDCYPDRVYMVPERALSVGRGVRAHAADHATRCPDPRPSTPTGLPLRATRDSGRVGSGTSHFPRSVLA